MTYQSRALVGTFLLIASQSAPSMAQTTGKAPQAWTLLEEGVASQSSDTRGKAIQALGLLTGSLRAAKLAEAHLADQDAEVRAAAATALGQIGLKSEAPKLVAMLKDHEGEVVFSAAAALYRLGDRNAYGVYYAVLTGARKTGEPLLESQMKMLKDPSALAKISLETGVGFIPFGGIGYKVVKSFTQDNVSPVRAAAAQKLALDPDPASGRALRDATSDDKWIVRASALGAIARRGDAALLPAAEARLTDDNETARFTAAAAVIRLSARRK